MTPNWSEHRVHDLMAVLDPLVTVTVEVFLNHHSRESTGNLAAGVKVRLQCLNKCSMVESKEKVPVDFKSL